MKSNEEIISFIDSKEAITERELKLFMYGYCSGRKKATFHKYWNYVLNTKDWKKLKEYAKYKEYDNGKFDKRNKYFELQKSDVRLQTLGSKEQSKLLKRIYNLDYNRQTIRRYTKLNEALCT